VALIVQKYGGTSVADSEKIRSAATRIKRAFDGGRQVVVVVSAMGKTTDELIRLAYQVTERPSPRELDVLVSTGEQISVALLAMALQSLGQDAISFTASQVGILTDGAHTKAKIVTINTERMRRELDDGKVVIVAGFQGITDQSDITTLGRGGSDTTAVALAAVLKADQCEIYTDVDGVYTADPRVVPDARKIREISYEEMLELASLGAGVLHPRSVEFAKKYDVPIHVRSSFSDQEGTMVSKEGEMMERIVVSGAALNTDEAKITIRSVPDRPGIAAAIFGRIAGRNVGVDMIVQNVSADGLTDVSFTVTKTDLADAVEIAEEIVREIGAKGVATDEKIAKISVVGVGMRSHAGVAAKMFQTLAEAGTNIQMISTSEIKISCVIDEAGSAEALRAVHKAFELEKTSPPDQA